VPGQIVSDNLKVGVTKACFYEPAVNRTYADMAAHYDTAVVAARPYKPRDKAKVVLDRLVHNAYRLNLDGPSMHKTKASDPKRHPS
jgi:transposase